MEKEIKQCDGKWNGYYIEANQEAYDLLVADGYKPYSEHTKNADFSL